MREFQNSVQNESVAIIGVSRREKRAGHPFMARDKKAWCSQRGVAHMRMRP